MGASRSDLFGRALQRRAGLAECRTTAGTPTSPKPAVEAPSSGASANDQMDQSSYPPLPQNETTVALNTHNEDIAVAASNDYLDGGVTVMRTADGGHSWATTRAVPVYREPGIHCLAIAARA